MLCHFKLGDPVIMPHHVEYYRKNTEHQHIFGHIDTMYCVCKMDDKFLDK